MARQKSSSGNQKPSKPARTPEEREAQLINLAEDLAEEQIRGGVASSQVITHYLKLGSSRERLEQMRISYENQLTEVKIQAMANAEERDAMYTKALLAMKRYSGQEVEEDDEYDHEEFED